MKGKLVLVTLVTALTAPAARADRAVLRVCADPNNFPLSGQRTPGFENEIAAVLARELGATLEYTWWAQRRGFVRNTLGANACDVVIGMPVGLDLVRTTRPYYRSSYVFVTRSDRRLRVRSLDDPRLKTLRIGVPLLGDDGANPPPVHALARRGIVDNVVGYNVMGDYAKSSPPADVMRAVAAGDVDIAIVWGPLAGGYARRSKVALSIVPVAEREDAGQRFAYDLALAVRKDDAALAASLDRALERRRRDIARILDRWRVPRLALDAPARPPGDDDDEDRR